MEKNTPPDKFYGASGFQRTRQEADSRISCKLWKSGNHFPEQAKRFVYYLPGSVHGELS